MNEAPRVSTHRRQRIAAILQALAVEDTFNVHRLAAGLGVSAATVRRDLAVLETQSLLRRTHGGAERLAAAQELPLAYRIGPHDDAKRRIAEACVEWMGNRQHQLIALSAGTTVAEVARRLVVGRGLTVVTNSVNIAALLPTRPGTTVVLTGGQLRQHTQELIGPLAERFLESIRINVAIVGAAGVSATHGLTTNDEAKARSRRAIIAHADQVVVVADGSKVGANSPESFGDPSRIDLLVTDHTAPQPQVQKLRAAGIQVVQV